MFSRGTMLIDNNHVLTCEVHKPGCWKRQWLSWHYTVCHMSCSKCPSKNQTSDLIWTQSNPVNISQAGMWRTCLTHQCSPMSSQNFGPNRNQQMKSDEGFPLGKPLVRTNGYLWCLSLATKSVLSVWALMAIKNPSLVVQFNFLNCCTVQY